MPSQPMKADTLLSKDATKKKKLNRSAKMKQMKLDVRREQWLSQVKGSEKSGEVEQTDAPAKKDLTPKALEKAKLSIQLATSSSKSHVEGSLEGSCIPQGNSDNIQGVPSIECSPGSIDAGKVYIQISTDCDPINSANEGLLERKGLESTNPSISAGSSENSPNAQASIDGGSFPESDEIDEDSGPPFKLRSDMLNDWFGGETSPCISRCSTNGDSSYMESMSEDEENVSKEDDWEAVAEAFEKQVSVTKDESGIKQKVLKGEISPSRDEETRSQSGFLLVAVETQPCLLKPDYTSKVNSFSPRTKSDGTRGWRSNDTSLLPVLPKLLKQQSAPAQSMMAAWAPPPTKKAWRSLAPSECPICTEELDITDSCFSPCTCGFQLCLFCHHKIAQDDGRCPGCRKAYKMKSALKS